MERVLKSEGPLQAQDNVAQLSFVLNGDWSKIRHREAADTPSGSTFDRFVRVGVRCGKRRELLQGIYGGR